MGHSPSAEVRFSPRPFAVRTAGLEISRLKEMRLVQSRALTLRLLEVRRSAAARRLAIADALYEAVGRCEPGPLKAALVALRRSVHNDRTLPESEWNESTRSAVGASLCDQIRALSALGADIQALETELEDSLKEETQLKRAAVRTITIDGGFRQGLLQASPILSAEADKWLDRPIDWASKQVVRRLATYIARAAAKVSPYSAFAGVGLGLWSSSHSERLAMLGSERAHVVVELNEALLDAIRAACQKEKGGSAGGAVRLNSTASLSQRQILFLRWVNGETITALAASPLVMYCMEHLLTSPSPTLVGLADGLAENVGRVQSGGVRAACEAAVERLAEIGLIEAVYPPALSIDELIQRVEARTETDPLLGPMRRLQAGLNDYAASVSHEERQASRRVAYTALTELSRHASIELGTAVRTGQDAYYDNVVSVDPLATANPNQWGDELAALDTVRKLLGLFDRNAPLRMRLAAFHRDVLGGRTVSFLEFFNSVHQILANGGDADWKQELEGVTNPMSPNERSSVDAVSRLYHLRHRARSWVRESPVDEHGAVSLQPTALKEWLAHRVGEHEIPASVAFHVQPVTGCRSVRLVLNAATCGYGRGISRVMYLIHQVDSPTLPNLRVPERGDGAIVAEIRGGLGSTLNLREAVLDDEICYPYLGRTLGANSGIRLSELRVVAEGVNGASVLRRGDGGQQVLPVHLGLMGEYFLPPAAQLLVRGFGATPTLYHPSRPFLHEDAWSVQPRGVKEFPRVNLGRLTLSRRTWILKSAEVPRQLKHETNSAFFARFHSWREQFGVPEVFYARSIPGAAFRRGQALLSKTWKPVYVDSFNWFLLEAFTRGLDAVGDLAVLQEALPHPDQPRIHGQQSDRMVELIVEVSGG